MATSFDENFNFALDDYIAEKCQDGSSYHVFDAGEGPEGALSGGLGPKRSDSAASDCNDDYADESDGNDGGSVDKSVCLDSDGDDDDDKGGRFEKNLPERVVQENRGIINSMRQARVGEAPTAERMLGRNDDLRQMLEEKMRPNDEDLFPYPPIFVGERDELGEGMEASMEEGELPENLNDNAESVDRHQEKVPLFNDRSQPVDYAEQCENAIGRQQKAPNIPPPKVAPIFNGRRQPIDYWKDAIGRLTPAVGQMRRRKNFKNRNDIGRKRASEQNAKNRNGIYNYAAYGERDSADNLLVQVNVEDIRNHNYGHVKYPLTPEEKTRALDRFQTVGEIMDMVQKRFKTTYNMALQKKIHDLQGKPLFYTSGNKGLQIVSSDGPGIDTTIRPNATNVSMNCRFC